MDKKIEQIDSKLIGIVRRLSLPFARAALFIVFFWFGLLKIVAVSPANPLVEDLLHKTLPFMSFATFNTGFAIFEILIGIMFLIPGLLRVVMPLLAIHMFTTFLPLILLPQVTWQSPFVPTLEGQYIIKNLVIVALALGIAAHMHPLAEKKTTT